MTVTAIRGDRLIDGQGNLVDQPAVVVWRHGEILSAGNCQEVDIPSGARVYDLTGCTLMPGMIDAHLHIAEFNPVTFGSYRAARMEVSPQLQAFYALFHSQICLEMGFTTLRDMGAQTYAGLNIQEMVALRDAIEAGIVTAPRLLVGGWATITGSHLDLIMPRTFPRVEGSTEDGPYGLRKLVRKHLRVGADFIKTCLSGGGGTDKEEPDIRNMTVEETEAVVDESHAFHKRTACHCFTAESQKRALRAGADTIEHCVWSDEEAIELLVEKDKYLTPTLAHRTDRAIEVRKSNGTPEFVTDKMKRIQADAFRTFQRLHEAGVKLAMGTDLQVDPEIGTDAMELEIYVQLGMSPMEALLTATRNAAEALGLYNLGVLKPGFLADIIAIRENPLEDITVLQEQNNIACVVKEGQVVINKTGKDDKSVIVDQQWKNKLGSILTRRGRDSLNIERNQRQ